MEKRLKDYLDRKKGEFLGGTVALTSISPLFSLCVILCQLVS